jgi:UDP-N-acetylmuramoyl-tripeptide--D-alanyl-D-alanine ligase
MKKAVKNYMQKKLGKWAREVWEKKKPYVIAVTGSMAKTSTKEAIFAVLKAKYGKEVFCSHGNMNSEFGLPLSILGFPKSINAKDYPLVYVRGWWRKTFKPRSEKYWVLEMGADKPHDIEYLTNIVKPDMAVVTTVGPSHLLNLGKVEGVFEEKADIVRVLRKHDKAVLNKNNDWTRKMAEKTEAQVVFFDPKIDEIAQEAARAVGNEMGVEKELVEKALSGVESMTGRMNVFELNGVTVIDDAYNANPMLSLIHI